MRPAWTSLLTSRRSALLACVLVSGACRSTPSPELDSARIRARIETVVTTPFPEHVPIERDRALLMSEALEFYRAREFEPAWMDPSGNAVARREVRRVLSRAEEHGLRADDYAVTEPANDEPSAARADIALSIATMRYIKDLHEGRVGPARLGLDLDVAHHHPNLSEELARVLDSEQLAEQLELFAPPYPAYARLRQALARYRRLSESAESERWRPLSDRVTIRPGEPYLDIDRLRHRLRQTGDLPELAEAARSVLYDDELVEAVRRFQARHGLNTDGVLGPRTLAQLNTRFRDRLRPIVASMERWRWVSGHFDGRALVVNIPEFRLRGIERNGGRHDVVFDSRVIVGQHYHELRTPVFSGQLGYIDFRPFWNVPLSIVRNELSDALDDADYLRAHAYEIVAGPSLEAESLAATPANVTKVRNGSLRLRQRPGPRNALGLVKFIFPNPHAVFLHSTPDVRLFQEEERAFSHGCIRVEDALGLAAWVLENQDGWNREAIVDALAGDSTTRVFVDRGVPVYVLYLTAFVDGTSGGIHFGPDIYELDAELLKILEEGR